MEKDIKREALRQYFKYFKIWFIIAGILAVITIGAAVVHALTPKPVRGNGQEPTERVYDYADMLTEEEEQSLREYIAECEEKIQADIVIVTISESVEYDLQDPDLPEAFHAKEVGSTDWSTAMRDLADNFYDYNNYGYNKVHGNAPGRGDKNFPFTQRHAVFFGVKPGNLLPKLRVPPGVGVFRMARARVCKRQVDDFLRRFQVRIADGQVDDIRISARLLKYCHHGVAVFLLPTPRSEIFHALSTPIPRGSGRPTGQYRRTAETLCRPVPPFHST